MSQNLLDVLVEICQQPNIYLRQKLPYSDRTIRSHGDVFAKLTTGCWDLLAIQRAGM